MTRVLLLASTAAASLLSLQAAAQETQPPATKDASTVEDLVVTATRRATRLQDADLSATVLDRQALDQARIRDIRQLDAAVANVQFNESGQLGSTFISIRGIESSDRFRLHSLSLAYHFVSLWLPLRHANRYSVVHASAEEG